jgi:hypothetical protein
MEAGSIAMEWARNVPAIRDLAREIIHALPPRNFLLAHRWL